MRHHTWNSGKMLVAIDAIQLHLSVFPIWLGSPKYNHTRYSFKPIVHFFTMSVSGHCCLYDLVFTFPAILLEYSGRSKLPTLYCYILTLVLFSDRWVSSMMSFRWWSILHYCCHFSSRWSLVLVAVSEMYSICIVYSLLSFETTLIPSGLIKSTEQWDFF